MVVLTEKGRKKVRSYVSDCADFYTASGLTAAESLPVPTEELILSEIPAEEVTDPASGRFYGTHWGIRSFMHTSLRVKKEGPAGPPSGRRHRKFLQPDH